MGKVIALLLMAPFVALADLLRLHRRWQAVPLQQRNMMRATGGAFVLVGRAVSSAAEPMSDVEGLSGCLRTAS